MALAVAQHTAVLTFQRFQDFCCLELPLQSDAQWKEYSIRVQNVNFNHAKRQLCYVDEGL